MHYDKTITRPKENPKMIQFYYDIKYISNIMDNLLGKYATLRCAIICPRTVFFNIVNIAALISYVTHTAYN